MGEKPSIAPSYCMSFSFHRQQRHSDIMVSALLNFISLFSKHLPFLCALIFFFSFFPPSLLQNLPSPLFSISCSALPATSWAVFRASRELAMHSLFPPLLPPPHPKWEVENRSTEKTKPNKKPYIWKTYKISSRSSQRQKGQPPQKKKILSMTLALPWARSVPPHNRNIFSLIWHD